MPDLSGCEAPGWLLWGAMPRLIAFEVLEGIFRRDARLEESFAAQPRLPGLSRRDRALARNLVATTLRRLGQIDALIDHFLDRPLPAKAGGARQVLRIGVCQILFLRTPAHAAVDESVRIAGARPALAPYKGLINAILRRVASEGPGLAAGHDAARLNTPPWLWRALSAAYGTEACRRIAEAHMHEPPLDVTVKGDGAVWAERLGGKHLLGASVRLEAPGMIDQLAGFAEGAWWVQDAAAALPIRLLGPVQGKTVIDLGAAPGGKTAQLVAAGARVIALDRSPGRLERLGENLDRLKLTARVICADGRDWRPETPVDMVLLDAPCSSTGTIRRHPDVAWRKDAKKLDGLIGLQRELLDAALGMLRPGGHLVFATCSLLPGEGTALIDDVVGSDDRVKLDPVAAEELDGRAEFLTELGELRTLPSHLPEAGGMDGFFAARLIRQ